jgi:dienelactone hydrolase
MNRLFWGAVSALMLAAPGAWAQLGGAKPIGFETRSADGTPLNLTGFVFEPPEPAKSAVVLLLSSAGMSDAVQGHYGRELSKDGHLVLALDSFTPRKISRTVNDQSQIGSMQMALDALLAREFIASAYPAVKRFAVMGFSKGGLASLFAADRRFHSARSQRFDAYLALYPSCAFAAKNPQPSGPVLMLFGAKDDYSGVEPCLQWAERFKSAGGAIEAKVYPDAHHSFDGDPSLTTPLYLARAENFLRCLVLLEDDGQWSYQGKRYPDQLATYPDLVKTCVRRGASIATNLKAKAAATDDAKAFLRSSLLR